MGRDKGSILFDGETLLERTARIAATAAEDAGASLLIVGVDRPTEWSVPEVRFLPDIEPGRGGPIVGLATALATTGGPVLLLPCDLPLLRCDLVTWLAETILLPSRPGASEVEGSLVRSVRGPEPLLSCYHDSLLPLLHERIAASRRSLRRLIEERTFVEVELPARFDSQLLNMNTPEDERRARLDRHSPTDLSTRMTGTRAENDATTDCRDSTGV